MTEPETNAFSKHEADNFRRQFPIDQGILSSERAQLCTIDIKKQERKCLLPSPGALCLWHSVEKKDT